MHHTTTTPSLLVSALFFLLSFFLTLLYLWFYFYLSLSALADIRNFVENIVYSVYRQFVVVVTVVGLMTREIKKFERNVIDVRGKQRRRCVHVLRMRLQRYDKHVILNNNQKCFVHTDDKPEGRW